jgi:hypothetical protein
MYNPFDAWKDLKCTKCVHGEICMQRMGGADLTVAVADCQHFKEAVELPKKFWIVFNVPGFYHITEYDVDRVLFDQGKLSRLWGTSKHQKDTVYAADFGRTVFFSQEEAEAGLNKLIEERRGEVNGEM